MEDEIKLITDGHYELNFPGKSPAKKPVEVIPPISPRKPFESYLKSEVPILNGEPITDPIFLLSKPDAHRAQIDLHNSIVKNETIRKPITNKCKPDSTDISLIDQSIVAEIDRYPRHHPLLSKVRIKKINCKF